MRISISIFFLAIITGILSPDASQVGATGLPVTISTVDRTTSVQLTSGSALESPPRKKPKKKRKTILNRKGKMRNGHSCPSF